MPLTDDDTEIRGYGRGFEDENYLNSRDEKGITPLFRTEVVRNAAESEKLGYDVFDEVEYIEIVRAGDKLNKWEGKVTTEHKQRFPNAYKRFRAGLELAKTGTPLEEWPLITKTVVYQWKAMGVTSVEDLADLDDGSLPNLGIDGRGWRNKAALWLKQRKDGAVATKAANENAKLQKEIDRLRVMVEQMSSNEALQQQAADNAAKAAIIVDQANRIKELQRQ